MVLPIQDNDFDEILSIAHKAVITNVIPIPDSALDLISDIKTSLQKWMLNKANSYHAKFVENEQIAGYIIVKEYWNLSQLFVHPSFQKSGIGKILIEEALIHCASKSPKSKLALNSSKNAESFYLKMGFTKLSEGLDRPGGCIPFEYEFNKSKEMGDPDPRGIQNVKS